MDMHKTYLIQCNEAAEIAATEAAAKDAAKTSATAAEPDTKTQTNASDSVGEPNATESAAEKPADADADAVAPLDSAAAVATKSGNPIDDADDEELNRLIRETMDQRRTGVQPAASTEEQQRRIEYEAMDVRQNAVHFHCVLFVGLLLLTLLNVASVLAWCQNIP